MARSNNNETDMRKANKKRTKGGRLRRRTAGRSEHDSFGHSEILAVNGRFADENDITEI